MARYLGPTCKLSRREGTDLLHKSGVRAIETKCKLDTQPGQHAQKRCRLSDYGVQLRMKQMIKRYYGVLEKQFLTSQKRRIFNINPGAVGTYGLCLASHKPTGGRPDLTTYAFGFHPHTLTFLNPTPIMKE